MSDKEHEAGGLRFTARELGDLNARLAHGAPSENEILPPSLRPRPSPLDRMVDAAFAELLQAAVPEAPRPKTPPSPPEAPSGDSPIASSPSPFGALARLRSTPPRRSVMSGEIDVRTTQPDLPAMPGEDSPFSSVEVEYAGAHQRPSKEVMALAAAIGVPRGQIEPPLAEDILSSTPPPSVSSVRVEVTAEASGSVRPSNVSAIEALSRAVLDGGSGEKGEGDGTDEGDVGGSGALSGEAGGGGEARPADLAAETRDDALDELPASARTPVVPLDESELDVLDGAEEGVAAAEHTAETGVPEIAEVPDVHEASGLPAPQPAPRTDPDLRLPAAQALAGGLLGSSEITPVERQMIPVHPEEDVVLPHEVMGEDTGDMTVEISESEESEAAASQVTPPEPVPIPDGSGPQPFPSIEEAPTRPIFSSVTQPLPVLSAAQDRGGERGRRPPSLPPQQSRRRTPALGVPIAPGPADEEPRPVRPDTTDQIVRAEPAPSSPGPGQGPAARPPEVTPPPVLRPAAEGTPPPVARPPEVTPPPGRPLIIERDPQRVRPETTEPIRTGMEPQPLRRERTPAPPAPPVAPPQRTEEARPPAGPASLPPTAPPSTGAAQAPMPPTASAPTTPSPESRDPAALAEERGRDSLPPPPPTRRPVAPSAAPAPPPPPVPATATTSGPVPGRAPGPSVPPPPPPLPASSGGTATPAPAAPAAAPAPPGPAPGGPPPPPPAAVAPPARPSIPGQPPPPPPTLPGPPPPSLSSPGVGPGPGSGEDRRKRRRGKPWFEEIFDEDYLRTLPYLTPRQTEQDVNFLIEVLQIQPGQRVLDVGCGYGRHSMDLASRGYRSVGLDLSLPLLIRAADAARRVGVNVDFVHGDMREMTFESEFDAAFCFFTTFGYFDDETNRKVAAGICRALRPGGRFVLDLINRDYLVGDLPTRVWWQGDGCMVLEEVDFNYFTSRLQVQRQIILEDGRQLEQEISIRTYSLHEIGKILHHAGFKVLEVSGGLNLRGRFFGADSRQLLVLAEKRHGDTP